MLRIAGVPTPFEDLDHVLDGYVGTLNRYIHDLVNSEKFLHGNAIDVDQILRTRKQQEPSKMHYAFWMDASKPGTVCVSYLKHANVRTENVSVSMNGFHFRGKPQPSPAHLAAALKKMCVEQDQQAAAAAVQAQAAAQQAAADAAARARVPYGHHQPPHYAVRNLFVWCMRVVCRCLPIPLRVSIGILLIVCVVMHVFHALFHGKQGGAYYPSHPSQPAPAASYFPPSVQPPSSYYPAPYYKHPDRR